MGYMNASNETYKSTLKVFCFCFLRPHLLYCLVDELQQGCSVPCRRKKKINKNFDFDSGRRKKTKKNWKVTFSIENQQIPYIFIQFLKKKNLYFFVHVGGKNKKKNEMSDFFSRRAWFHHVGGPRRPNIIVRAALPIFCSHNLTCSIH